MHIEMLKAKIHRATVTHTRLDYEGSCALDNNLLEVSGIKEYEKISIFNVTNGERFDTYAIQAIASSGIVSINGAAAHKANPGDIIIICSFASFNESEAKQHKPSLVYVDRTNCITHSAEVIPAQSM